MTSLTLEVSPANATALTEQKQKCFEQRGGTVGRANHNDWVLPDAQCHISSRHAEIEYSDNTYYLKDTSTNGVFIDRSSTPLGRGNRILIQNKMHIKIGDYEITARLKVSGGAAAHQNPSESQTHLGAFFSSPLQEPLGHSNSTPSPDNIVAAPSMSNASIIDPLEALMQAAPDSQQRLDPGHRAEGPNASKPPSYNAQEGSVGFIDSVFTNMHSSSKNPEHDTGLAAKDRNEPLNPSHSMEKNSDNQANDSKPEQVFNIPDDWDKTEWGKAPEPTLGQGPKANGVHSSQQSATPLAAAPAITPVPPETPHTSPTRQSSQTAPAAPSHLPAATKTSADKKATDSHTPPALAAKNENKEDADLIAMLQGLGIDPTGIDSKTIAAQWINMMPLVLTGLIKMLHIRGEVKSQFRAEKTTIHATENNPIKFSCDASMAIHNLFIAPLKGFKAPEAAMAEVLHDLAVHQQAMTAGLQSGFEEFTERLSPAAIEQKTQRISSETHGLINKLIGTKHWPVYIETYNGLMQGSNNAFLKLFGEKFVSTYEDFIRDNEISNDQTTNHQNPSPIKDGALNTCSSI